VRVICLHNSPADGSAAQFASVQPLGMGREGKGTGKDGCGYGTPLAEELRQIRGREGLPFSHMRRAGGVARD
jgi:hypothetical protein